MPKPFMPKHNSFAHRTAVCAALLGTALCTAGPVFAATAQDGAAPSKPETTPEVKVDHSAVDRGRAPGTSYAPLVQKVAPSVVEITVTEKAQRNPHGFSQDQLDQLRRLFGQGGGGLEGPGPGEGGPFPHGGGGGAPVMRGLGSGVIVSPDGYILTNNHVVNNASEISVALADGRVFPHAKVIGADPKTDIAVIKINAENLPALTFADSSQISVGDVVLAIGNPFGIGQTVTQGIVSGKDRVTAGGDQDEDFIQTDAAINPGNSGGALVDMDGRLVGINSEILSRSGGSQGVGLAIPSNLCQWAMTSLVKTGHIERGFMGVSIQDVTPDLAKDFKLDHITGALVSDVVPGSPAERGGLKSGDVIREYDNHPVKDASQFKLQVAETSPGSKATIGFIRDGETKSVDLTVGHFPNEKVAGNDDGAQGGHKDALAGVGVADLDQGVRTEANIPENVRGALITEVAPNSPAAEAGLAPGDVITEINHQPVRTAQDAVNDTQKPVGDQTLVKIWTNRGSHYVTVDESARE
jgi:serine protease Do